MRACPYHTRFSFLFARVRAGCQQEPVFGDQGGQTPTRCKDGSPEHGWVEKGQGPPPKKQIRSDQYLTPSVCVCVYMCARVCVATAVIEKGKAGMTRKQQQQQQHQHQNQRPTAAAAATTTATAATTATSVSSGHRGRLLTLACPAALRSLASPHACQCALLRDHKRGVVLCRVGAGVGCVMGMVMRQRLGCSVLLWRTFLLLSVAVQRAGMLSRPTRLHGISQGDGRMMLAWSCLMPDVMRDA